MEILAQPAVAGAQWTLGVKIGLPFAIFGALALLVSAVVFIAWWINESDRLTALVTVPLSLVVLGLYTGGIIWAYWPLQAQYHQYRTVSGTVQTVANRLVSAGDKGGSNQKFVVTLIGGSQQYGIEDTRAALLKPGDRVDLRCIRKYDYGSNNAGYDCKWGQS